MVYSSRLDINETDDHLPLSGMAHLSRELEPAFTTRKKIFLGVIISIISSLCLKIRDMLKLPTRSSLLGIFLLIFHIPILDGETPHLFGKITQQTFCLVVPSHVSNHVVPTSHCFHAFIPLGKHQQFPWANFNRF